MKIWDVVDRARAQASDPGDAYEVAEVATALLAAEPPAVIVEAAADLARLFAESYRADLWAAAYLIHGGASDDAFDYFRGWLVAQGRTVFEAVVADPDGLADLPAVRAALVDGDDLECETMLSIAWDAYEESTGEELGPLDPPVVLPPIDLTGRDFDDEAQMTALLPRLSALVQQVEDEDDDEDGS